MKRYFAFAFFMTAAILLWRQTSTQAQITNPQPAPAADALQAMTLIFGSKDMEPAKWDGSAAISEGRIERIAGYHFTTESKILDGNRWECATHAWGPFAGGMHPDERPQPQPTPTEPIGVTIEFRARPDARIAIKTSKGDFEIRPMDVPAEGGIFPLNANVEVYRTPLVRQASLSDSENDYPSLAASEGGVWLAWQGYKAESDQVFLRRYSEANGGKWGERLTVTEKPAEVFMTAVALSNNQPVTIWSERDGENWRLKSRAFDGSRFGATQLVTSGEGSHLFHRVATDRTGNLYVVYQSANKSRADIYLQTYSSGKWSAPVLISDPRRSARANDWNPAVVADRAGIVWVAWDSYAAGNYDIYLRPVRNGRPGEAIRATTSTRFHAHPSLAVDDRDRVWLAYDEAPENWGKDVGFLLKGGTGLYQSRTIRVAVYAGGKWWTTLQQPGEVVPYGFRRYFQTPRIMADAAGRIWLLARPRTSARLPTSLWAAGGKWETVATYYKGDRWSEPQTIPDSVGRNEGDMAAAAGPSGDLSVAIVTDRRLWGGAAFGGNPQNNEIVFTQLRASAPSAAQLAERPGEEPAGLPTEPREKEQIAALRAYTIANGGKSYKIYRGDMHRHTDISADGAGDGSLCDAYRYALDAAGLDWFLLTDHQSGGQEYTWWRTQKAVDMFHAPGFFTTLYGTERSLPYPNGHRNLVFAQRTRILPITPEEQKSSTGPVLYPYLRANKGIAASHTSHTGMGTDWRDNDPALEPIVEIYQGARTSAEHEGAPLSPSERRTELHAGGYKPLGFVWNAWAKGYKLGVQASSDHVSTHISYACVIAENSSREALLDAMRRRHTYAATSNIVMDYRMTAGAESYIQGDIAKANALPELRANIVGTGPLKKVVVVRDNQYIYTQEPRGASYELRYRENQLAPGEHYYYVRAEQQDGNMAWSSPIWITYR